jgi:hypothetical protein
MVSDILVWLLDFGKTIPLEEKILTGRNCLNRRGLMKGGVQFSSVATCGNAVTTST